MDVTTSEVEARIAAISLMLARGAVAEDVRSWTPELRVRVQDAVRQAVKRVDWAALGQDPDHGAEWISREIEKLVEREISQLAATGTLRGTEDAAVVSLKDIAVLAVEEWLRHDVGWIPESVTEIINTSIDDEGDRGRVLAMARQIRNERLEPARAQKQAERAERRAERERRIAVIRQKDERELFAHRVSTPAPAPAPQPFGVSHEGAEHLCREWMRYLGAMDAEVTRYVGDGGIDVESSEYVAQVKNYARSSVVAVSDIRDLAGVAAVEGKRGLLFTSGTVTADGHAFAERANIAILGYDAVDGTIFGINTLGASCVQRGLTFGWSMS